MAVATLSSLPATADPDADCAVPVPAALREEALRLTNQARAQPRDCGLRGHFAGAPALRWSAPLEAVADRQAQWLAPTMTLSHEGPAGQTIGQRAREAGYRFGRVTENLAHGQRDVATVIEQWLASDGHCANLMDGGVREFALVCRASGDGRPLWAMVLARPR